MILLYNNNNKMKKVILILIGISLLFVSHGQVSKTYLKTKFEAFDKPTEEDFGMFIDNTYNYLQDGILKSSGTSIAPLYSPYTSRQVGKFYTGSETPISTAPGLNYDGIFRATEIYIGNTKIDSSFGERYWFFDEDELRLNPQSPTHGLAIGNESLLGYDLRVSSRALFDYSITTDTIIIPFDVLGPGYPSAKIFVDGDGYLVFDGPVSDEVKLADIISGGGFWTNNNGVLYPVSLTDGLAINTTFLYGYDLRVNGKALFDDGVKVDTLWINNGYYNSYLYTSPSGALVFNDDIEGSASLGQLIGGSGGFFERSPGYDIIYPSFSSDNLMLGAGAFDDYSSYKLSVLGSQLITGTLNFNLEEDARIYAGGTNGGKLFFKDEENTTPLSLSDLIESTEYWREGGSSGVLKPAAGYSRINIGGFEDNGNPLGVLGDVDFLGHTHTYVLDAKHGIRLRPIDDYNSGWNSPWPGKLVHMSEDTTLRFIRSYEGIGVGEETYEERTLIMNEDNDGYNIGADTIYSDIYTLNDEIFNWNIDYFFNSVDTFATLDTVRQLIAEEGGGGSSGVDTNVVVAIVEDTLFNSISSDTLNSTYILSDEKIRLVKGSDTLFWDGTYLYHAIDTFSTQAYSRSYGGTGTVSTAENLTTNYLPKATAAAELSNSQIIDYGDSVIVDIGGDGADFTVYDDSVKVNSLNGNSEGWVGVYETGVLFRDSLTGVDSIVYEKLYVDTLNVTKAQKIGFDADTNTSASGSITLDCGAYNIFELTMTGNITSLDYSNATTGTYIIALKQDASGGATVAFATNKWQASAGSVSIDSGANELTILSCYYHADTNRMIVTDINNLSDL